MLNRDPLSLETGKHPIYKKATRTCLRCQREFVSINLSNRVCGKCNKMNSNVYTPSTYKCDNHTEED